VQLERHTGQHLTKYCKKQRRCENKRNVALSLPCCVVAIASVPFIATRICHLFLKKRLTSHCCQIPMKLTARGNYICFVVVGVVGVRVVGVVVVAT
jgi:hypothetical protein